MKFKSMFISTLVHFAMIYSIINNVPYVVGTILTISCIGVLIQCVVVHTSNKQVLSDYLQRIKHSGGHPVWNDASLLWPLSTICVLGYYQHTVTMLIMLAMMILARHNIKRSAELYSLKYTN